MCLIAYNPTGTMLDRAVIHTANEINSDGIGVMSAAGVVKFMGKRKGKKLRRYLQTVLVPQSLPYAVHFRYATHGAVNEDNCHPFAIPDGRGYLMHNGVISWCGYDAHKSDTAVFTSMLDDFTHSRDIAMRNELAKLIGYGSKLCIMDSDYQFSLVNEDAGEWISGVWYSNTYSLPTSMQPKSYYKVRDGYRMDELAGESTTQYHSLQPSTTGPIQPYLRQHYLGNRMPMLNRTTGGLIIPADEDDYQDLDDAADLAVQRDDRADARLLLAAPTGYRDSEEIRSTKDYYASWERELAEQEAFDQELALEHLKRGNIRGGK